MVRGRVTCAQCDGMLVCREKIWIETGLSNHLKVYKWVPGELWASLSLPEVLTVSLSHSEGGGQEGWR